MFIERVGEARTHRLLSDIARWNYISNKKKPNKKLDELNIQRLKTVYLIYKFSLSQKGNYSSLALLSVVTLKIFKDNCWGIGVYLDISSQVSGRSRRMLDKHNVWLSD